LQKYWFPLRLSNKLITTSHKYSWSIINVQWREMTEGFKQGSPYSDVTNSPSELPTESPTEWVRQWFQRQKLIYHHSADCLLPISPSSSSSQLSPPKLQTTTQKKNPPFLNTSHISLSFFVTTSMFWFIMDFIIFCK